MIYGRVICRFDLSNLSSQFNSLRSADAFLVVASLPPKERSEEKRRPEIRLCFESYQFNHSTPEIDEEV